MDNWVIINLVGNMSVLTVSGNFSQNMTDARRFATQASAQAVADTIKCATLVQQLGQIDSVKTDFPVPDFFDSNLPLMTLKEMIQVLRSDDLTEHFTPVAEITGANQMTSGGIEDPLDGRLIAREYIFTFDRVLTDADAQEFYNEVKRAGWSRCTYRRVTLGFTGYTVINLRAQVK